MMNPMVALIYALVMSAFGMRAVIAQDVTRSTLTTTPEDRATLTVTVTLSGIVSEVPVSISTATIISTVTETLIPPVISSRTATSTRATRTVASETDTLTTSSDARAEIAQSNVFKLSAVIGLGAVLGALVV